MEQITTPAQLIETVNAFRTSRLILSAIELRVFDIISGKKMTSSEIAGIAHTDPRATDRFLNALVGQGLVVKNNGTFSNSPFSDKFLVSSSAQFMAGMDHMVGLWRTWNTLTDAVKTGTSLAETVRNSINDRGEKWLEAFIAAMHARGMEQGRELVSMLDLSGTHRTLDVGGGSGAFSFAFIERNPEIKAFILDLPNVVPITQRYIEKEGYTGKAGILKGDYLKDDFGKDYDLVLMSAIIHINNPEENTLLIRKGAEALAEGGQLVIIDHVMNESRTEPIMGTMFALNMLVGTKHGDTYTEKEYRGWMKDSGLNYIKLKTSRSGMQVMIGRKTAL